MVPEGYQKLAVIGISYKGEYSTSKTYKQLNAVYYKGSTYVALKDSPVGPPAHDGVNWNYVAKGLLNAMLNEIKAVDTSGLIGSAGASVSTQSLFDVIADKVATKLISKNMIVNDFLSTNPETVLSGPMGKELKDMLEQQNRDFGRTKDAGFGYPSNMFAGEFSEIKDCNNIPPGTVYYVYGSAINSPSPGTNSIVLTIGIDALYSQIGIPFQSPDMYIRSKYTNGWTAWTKK